MNLDRKLVALKKSFGNHSYHFPDAELRDKILNHPLFNGLWTIGPSFSIIANTNNWIIEHVAGDCEIISGFSCEEIMQLQGKFIMEFPVENHTYSNMTAVKMGMEYLTSRPEQERTMIYVVYFYHARKKDGGLLTIQHQSIPMVFDETHIPYIFCNIYSDISYLKPSHIPMGLVINRHLNESFEVDSGKSELLPFRDIFSEREKEIIRLLISGMNSRQIAEKLYISYETVRTHRKNILRRADLTNTGQLVHYCLFNGVI